MVLMRRCVGCRRGSLAAKAKLEVMAIRCQRRSGRDGGEQQASASRRRSNRLSGWMALRMCRFFNPFGCLARGQDQSRAGASGEIASLVVMHANGNQDQCALSA